MEKLELLAQYKNLGFKLTHIPQGQKGPVHKKWHLKPTKYKQLSNGLIDYNTGLLHSLSGLVCFDIDNVTEMEKLPALKALLATGLQYTSGKPNRNKVIFRIPDSVDPKIFITKKLRVTPHTKNFGQLRCCSSSGFSVQDVLPPSKHPEGYTYCWISDLPERREDIPELPNDIVVEFQQRDKQSGDKKSDGKKNNGYIGAYNKWAQKQGIDVGSEIERTGEYTAVRRGYLRKGSTNDCSIHNYGNGWFNFSDTEGPGLFPKGPIDEYDCLIMNEYNGDADLAKREVCSGRFNEEIKQAIDALYSEGRTLADVKPCKPIQRLLDGFKDTIAYPQINFYFPTVYTFVNLIIQSLVVLPLMRFRHINLISLAVGKSTDAKDNNMSVPLEGLSRQLINKYGNSVNTSVMDILNELGKQAASVTAYSTMMMEIHENNVKAWLDTEASTFLELLSTKQKQKDIAGISDAIVALNDGVALKAKTKVTGGQKAAYNVTIPFLLAVQSELLQEALKLSDLHKGVLGRFDYYYVDDNRTGSRNPFKEGNIKPFILKDKKLLAFLKYAIEACCKERSTFPPNENKQCIHVIPELTVAAKTIMMDWHDKEYQGSEEWGTDAKKFLDRISISFEKMVTLDATMNHLWGCWKSKGKKKPFKGGIIIEEKHVLPYVPFANYQLDVRRKYVLGVINDTGETKASKQERRFMEAFTALTKKKKEKLISIRDMKIRTGFDYRVLNDTADVLKKSGIMKIHKEGTKGEGGAKLRSVHFSVV